MSEIIECEFEYKCPLKWENLKETEDSKIKFCNECNKNVYHCETSEDIDKHRKLNHCVAVDGPEPTAGVLICEDVPRPPEDVRKNEFIKQYWFIFLLIICSILYFIF